MFVSVYAIAKNEEKFVERWYESVCDADEVILVDTGSTDDTVDIAEGLGCRVYQIHIAPWRFDDARNFALSLVSKEADWCFSIDLDEVLLPGWREALEGFTGKRPTYKYVWSFNDDGSEGTTFLYDKIHRRFGYRWINPCHEIIVPTEGEDVKEFCPGIEVHHFPDPGKSRSQYLPLLELAVKENPSDDRMRHYLGREYMFNGRAEEAINTLKSHLEMESATWDVERAASMRMIARCLPDDPFERERWLLRACGEAPYRRGPWIELAEHYLSLDKFDGCRYAVSRALEIQERPSDYLTDPRDWGSLPFELDAMACHYLGLYEEERVLWEEALKFAPEDARIKENLLLASERVNESSSAT